MSSFARPHSPPETPGKATMAVEKGHVTPKARLFTSRSGDSQPAAEMSPGNVQQLKAQPSELSSSNDAQEPLVTFPPNGVEQPTPGSEIQVPSTIPYGDLKYGSTAKTLSQPEQIDSVASEDPPKEAEDDSPSRPNPTDPLPLMDWDEFEIRYRKALQEANEHEDSIVKEFDALVETFSHWAVAPAERDNERGWKRMKTRERYVQLSEARLKEKQDHYSEVVKAFQMALDLLKR